MSADVLQATAWYGPHHVGGTEIYVEGLVEALTARGIRSTVLTPRTPGALQSYRHGGHLVETYPLESAPSTEPRAPAPRHEELEAFRRLLKASPAAIYHQQSWTPSCGPAHLKVARDLGMRTVLTVHIAAVPCLRGSMLRFGKQPCSGRIETTACGACWAHFRGLPRPLATAIAHVPISVGRRLNLMPSRLATALAARTIAADRAEQMREMISSADRIVAVCRWLADALLINGVSADKLVLSRQGISPSFVASAADGEPRTRTSGPLAVLYLGRWDSIKGIEILVRAVKKAQADLELTICAIAQTEDDHAYAAHVKRIGANDARIRFADPVPRGEVAAELGRHDVLAVPSLTMETGPLVVLEAQAAGLYILGSRLGGIAELVTSRAEGELVEPGNVVAWAQAIERLALRRVRRGEPLAVRTMRDVAGDMAELYNSL